MTNDPTQDALDLLEEILCEQLLSDREQRPLRQLAALQMQAHAWAQPSFCTVDRQVAGLLVGRWLHTLTDSAPGPTLTTEPFEVTARSLASVLGLEAQVVERSLQQLIGCEFIAVEPAEGTFGVDFTPLFRQIAQELATLLYRDFLDRHGLDLRDTAIHFLETIAENISELTKHRPNDLRVTVLRADFKALKARSTPDELLALWPVKPKAFYAWLEDLAAIEERLAILTKFPDMALAFELGRRASERILILSGRLAQHPAPPAATAKAR